MNVLLIRHDADGASWKEYHLDDYRDYYDDNFARDIRAHLNTVGVTRLEIIPS